LNPHEAALPLAFQSGERRGVADAVRERGQQLFGTMTDGDPEK
jgi:hypothetical protein